MRYLAQVIVEEQASHPKLLLLAQQASEYTWLPLSGTVISGSELRGPGCSGIEQLLHQGQLLLVKYSDDGQILSCEDATPWILELIQTYLSQGLSIQFLRDEAERAEQCRQALTLEKQAISQQLLENESRREELQTLEENLKRERQLLDQLAHQLKGNMNDAPA
jgi:hypothetical protein